MIIRKLFDATIGKTRYIYQFNNNDEAKRFYNRLKDKHRYMFVGWFSTGDSVQLKTEFVR